MLEHLTIGVININNLMLILYIGKHKNNVKIEFSLICFHVIFILIYIMSIRLFLLLALSCC